MSIVSFNYFDYKYGKAISHEIAVKVLLLGIAALKIYLLFGLTVKNLCVDLQKQPPIGLHLITVLKVLRKPLKIPVKVFFRNA